MGISIGLVGLGSFMRCFAKLFVSHPLVSRVAFCDREADRVAAYARNPVFRGKFREGDCYTSLEEICRSDLDALVIITQPWLHAAQCVQAMQNGKHVYSAVPIVSLPDGGEILDWCEKLVETCRRTGLRYMLGETTYYRPEATYCRRRAAEGAFGSFVFAEGEYYHDVDDPGCSLRKVERHRMNSQAGREWARLREQYESRGVRGGPMHYPTHSTCGPIATMGVPARKVCCWGWRSPEEQDREYFRGAFANETALFQMGNGATVRINEYRKIAYPGAETFRVYGSGGCFEDSHWADRTGRRLLSLEEMREPLPTEVYDSFLQGVLEWEAVEKGLRLDAYSDKDFQAADIRQKVYGGHGGSHAYLVNEFVQALEENRHPAIHAWEAARYMAAGVVAHQSALKEGEVLAVPDWGEAP